jgi:ATPase subunit of ABC transporter with duplicated ATPase domains
MGQNGAGKSTLLKLIVGTLPADTGLVTLGASVKLGYFAQHTTELLDGDRTVFETLFDAFPTASQGTMRTLAGSFGFPGEDADKKVRVLSGGEKARVVLARMLFDPPNLLVLDEPTNHLDVTTKDLLVDALSDFEGTMIFVSHDRRFLSSLSTRVLELSPGADATVYPGGYREYVTMTGREAPGLRAP